MPIKIHLPLMNQDVFVLSPDEMPVSVKSFGALPPTLPQTLPPTPLPVDSSGHGTASCGMDGNDRSGNCALATVSHIDNIWTYRQGKAVQSQYDDQCMADWYNLHGGDSWVWGINSPIHCASGAPTAYPQPVVWGTLNVTWDYMWMMPYLIDQFYALGYGCGLPLAFANGFHTGSVWPKNIGWSSAGHAMALSDVAGPNDVAQGINISGFYRAWTWGTWCWVSAPFLLGMFGLMTAYFSPRQFDPKTGLDSKGRHITTQAAAWSACGGAPISPSLLSLFPPPGAVRPSPQIIDNGHTGYSDFGPGWYTYPTPTTGAPVGYGGSVRVSPKGGGTGLNVASWVSQGWKDFTCDVGVTWVGDPNNRASNAPYQIWDGTSLLATIPVDQRASPVGSKSAGGRTFKSLGQFLCKSGTLKVVLSDNCNGAVVADAVMVS